MFKRDILVGFICFKVKNLEFNDRQARQIYSQL